MITMEPPARRPPALPGVVAAVLALGVTEFLAGALPGGVSLVGAVGDAAVDWLPTPVIRFGIEAFGTDDKTVLVGIVLLTCLLLGGFFARRSARRPALALMGFPAFGLVGILAATRDPQAGLGATVVAGVTGAAAGAIALRSLLRLHGAGRRPGPAPVAAPPGPDGTPGSQSGPVSGSVISDRDLGRVVADRPLGGPTGTDRRAFLSAMGAVAALGVGAALVGRTLNRAAATASRLRYALPGVARPLPPVPPEATAPVPGMTPVVVPNKDFYVIDTRLLGPPQVDVDGWRLRVSGLVDRPFELTYDELLSLPMVEEYVTLSCVSNEVGGDLVGNAAWRGVPLATLLERAGVQPEAGQIVGRSVDGFTAGFPVGAATDGRHALVAVGMNGELLPLGHGFPARLVVAGLYGFISATKWLEEIELTTWDGFDGYWIPRGWSKYAPVKVASRIDRTWPDKPTAGQPLVAAGVAWAPHRGIARVEVQVDEEPWRDAELAAELNTSAWRQWLFRWTAGPGRHRLRVRATTADGETQTGASAPPAPNGATGYHAVRVTVAGDAR